MEKECNEAPYIALQYLGVGVLSSLIYWGLEGNETNLITEILPFIFFGFIIVCFVVSVLIGLHYRKMCDKWERYIISKIKRGEIVIK